MFSQELITSKRTYICTNIIFFSHICNLLSHLLRRWRFSATSIFSLAKERLEPLLNEAKPGILGEFSQYVITIS